MYYVSNVTILILDRFSMISEVFFCDHYIEKEAFDF